MKKEKKTETKIDKKNKQKIILDIKKIEKKWQDYWEKEKIYKFNQKSKKKIFSIDTPPPTVSADHLHVGHAMHYSQFEFIARFKRMRGFNVLFPMGFDDNGLPTEKFTEEKHKINIKEISREKFRNLCYETASKVIKEDMKPFFISLGFSCQWPAYRTIDNNSQKLAQISFLDLYKKGHLYRAEEPILWCPYHQTALAQATVESKSRTAILYYIYFNVEKKNKNDKNKQITIATTRPELLSSCVAIFVNPKDKRYKNLVGKKVKVPLFDLKVPVIEENDVDMGFGTGIVMCCTFGDTSDVLWWKKHKLPMIISLTKDGKLNKNSGKYQGLTIEKAKQKIVEDLKNKNLIEKQEEIEQTIGVCWRCSTPIELIPTKQWFVRILPFKEQLIKQGKRIRWFPVFSRRRYEEWVNNLSWDWCISRQRYYGVPIPVWYCKKCGQVILPKEKDFPIDPTSQKLKKTCKCGSKEFIPEYDVLDTWFTSSMTPELATEWNSKLLPFSLRPQAHDIIRTWAFYTILKSFLHHNNIPWKNVMISGFGLAPDGKPMHKSLGNAIWINPVLEKYGADAFRFWASSTKLGEDSAFREKELVAGKKFTIKLWNAAKFVSLHLKKIKKKPKQAFDIWIMSKINSLTSRCTKYFEEYEYSKTKAEIENFFWHTFCDNYLEITKNRLYKGKKQEKESAQYALYNSFLTIIKLLAPIMPHMTEELYQQYFKKQEKKKSIHISEWPKHDEKLKNKKTQEIEKLGDQAIEIITEVRQQKTKAQKSLKAEIILTLEKKQIKELKNFMPDIKAVTNAKEIKQGKFNIKILK